MNYYLNLGFTVPYTENKVEVSDSDNSDGPWTLSDGNLTVNSTDGYTGTWQYTDGYDIGFYAIAGGSEFALYFVYPFEENGIWTTEHVVAGASGNTPQISHFSANPVPEPATLLLLGTGLVGLAAGARRKTKKG